MPTVGEFLNLRVLVAAVLRLRFGRWGYYRTFITCSKAKIILVWHDTNIESYLLGHHTNIPIAVIQNGLRHDVSPVGGLGLISNLVRLQSVSPRATAYFAFAEPSAKRLSTRISADFQLAGSFRLNEFAVSNSRETDPGNNRDARLGFIVSLPNGRDIPGGHLANNKSAYAIIEGSQVSYSSWFSADAVTAKALAVVCDSLSIDFSIIGKRSVSDSTERDFFQSIPGLERVPVLNHEKGLGYEVCKPFDFLFTVDSTLGYEMLALGHKVGFVSNRFRIAGIDSDEMTFAHPLDVGKDGPIWTSATTTEGISEFIYRFLSLSDVEWQSIRTTLVPRLMALDPGNTKLRAYIDRVLAGSQ
jgi:surface carbohydrate biosynthesis protein